MILIITCIIVYLIIVGGEKIDRNEFDTCGQLKCDAVRPHCIVKDYEFVCVGPEYFGNVADTLDVGIGSSKTGYYFHGKAEVKIYHVFDGSWIAGRMVTMNYETYAVERDEMTDGRLVCVFDRGSLFLLKFFGVEKGEIRIPTTAESVSTMRVTTTTTTTTTRRRSEGTTVMTTKGGVTTESTSRSSTTRTLTSGSPTLTVTGGRTETVTSTVTGHTSTRTTRTTRTTTTTRKDTTGHTTTLPLTTQADRTVRTTVSVKHGDGYSIELIVSCVCVGLILILFTILGVVYKCKKMGSRRLQPLTPLNNGIYKTTVHPGRDLPDHSRIDLSIYDDTKF